VPSMARRYDPAMFGTWEGPDIAAFWFALGAFILSLGSVIFTGAAHQREVRRERERQRPDVNVHFGKWVKEPIVAVLVIENLGGKRINQAIVKAARGDPKLVGFAEDETTERSHAHSFRELEPGVPQSVHFVNIDKAVSDKGVVKFLVNFRHDDDAWEKLCEARLPPPGPVVLFGRAH
jgi:hypothetical protein